MFCNNCGVQNPDGSNYCSNCGKKLFSKNESAQPANTLQYTVEIFRESQLFPINPPINLFIKGQTSEKKLSIANGENVCIQLCCGEYEFVFSQSVRKRVVNVNLDHDIHIDVKWNRLTGAIETTVI